MLYYYEDVIPVIKELLGDPKIIIMLREPASRAFSAYKHLVRDSREKESFSEGLRLEDERMSNNFEFIWAYRKESMYYSAVKAYLDNFTDVKIIIFEDFIKHQEDVVNDTLKFLGLKISFTSGYAIENKSGKPKSKTLHKLLTQDYLVKDVLKKVLGESSKAKIKNYIFNKNLNKIPEDKEAIERLKSKFEAEIDNLENLLGINLDVWKR